MHHLIYFSQATNPFTEADLVALLEQARARNQHQQITGALVYGQGQFMQVLEGEEPVISQLYELIKQDPRHRNVFKLADKEITERRFPEWGMAFAGGNPAELAQQLGYLPPAQVLAYPALQAPSAADSFLMERMRELLK